MALTQMQLIQSLGEAMAWFEREISWGVPATELRHLCGRIGELYVAMLTNGQMALEVNQRGYDVIGANGERISVKTTASSSNGQILFNPSTIDLVDRIIILRVNTDEMQIEVLLDCSCEDAKKLMTPTSGGKSTISISKLQRKPVMRSNLQVVAEVIFAEYTLRELENGSIEILLNSEIQIPTKPHLRTIAHQLGLSVLAQSGNPLTTRQLGTQLIRLLSEKHS